MYRLVVPADRVMFPNGPTVYLYDDYPTATLAHDMASMLRRTSRDGKVRVFCMTDDPEELLGIEPAAFIDRTSRPWPAAAREMIEWRALRAGAPINTCVTYATKPAH